MYVNAGEPKRTWNIIAKGVVQMSEHSGKVDKKVRRKYGPDGKKNSGFHLISGEPFISLKKVVEIDNSGIRASMLNLEKSFNKLAGN